MNEEKDLLENEEVTEAEVEETVVAEETEIEETADVVEDGAEAEDELGANYVPNEETEDVQTGGKISAGAAAAIAVAVCVVLMVAGYFYLDKQHKDYIASLNQYNLDKDGYMQTLDEVADEEEITLDEFKAKYSLPADMTGDTYYAVATNYFRLEDYMKMQSGVTQEQIDAYKAMFGIESDFELLCMMMGVPTDDRITADMPFGEFMKVMKEITEENKAASEEEATLTEGESTSESVDETSEEAETAPAEGETVTESVETAPEQSEAAPAE